MKDDEWHSGPPPSVGWWPADLPGFLEHHVLRWWDGLVWSIYVYRHATAEEAGELALRHSPCSEIILWKRRPDNWPKRSKT